MTRRSKMLLAVAPLVLVVMFVSGSYVVLTLDPFKWGVAESDKFSWAKFGSIKKGDRVVDVIGQLGEPIRPPEPLKAIDPNDPCIKGGCKLYVFAGGLWGPTFKEAIVVSDSKGFVIQAIERQE